jgi:type IV secretion system protein VirB9
MTMKHFLILASAFALFGNSIAADLPEPSELDARVRYVTYKKDDVTLVTVRRGTVTRIVLGEDESISVAATGFTADCKKDEYEWCIRTDVGTNQVWVKPKDGATFNNLELRTNKRDYSFEFRVLDDKANGRGTQPANHKVLQSEPMFRVIFRYPVEVPPMSAFMAMQLNRPLVDEKSVLDTRLKEAKPIPRNWKYTMQVMKGGEEIAPSIVFDDGRFTYFEFPANREIPTFYYISPTGEESRVNFHMEGNLVVVQKMGRKFVLRLGAAVVGVFNEAFDLDGVAPVNGATVDGVIRTVKSKE